jgi:multidrug efflux pump subunit AcrB
VPPQDQNFIRMSMQTAVGSSLAFTDGKTTRWRPTCEPARGAALFRRGGRHQRRAQPEPSPPVTLVDKDQREKSQAELIQEFRKDLGKMRGCGSPIRICPPAA